MKLNNIQFDLNSFAAEMEKLKNDQHFDFLVTIVGEDFGEEGLGCIYILENTLTHERMSVKAVNANRDEAYIPSVSHLWKAAEILEREVYDFFGIIFTGNPDMRRIFLRSDFVGYPMRKDYDMDPEKNKYVKVKRYRAKSAMTKREEREFFGHPFTFKKNIVLVNKEDITLLFDKNWQLCELFPIREDTKEFLDTHRGQPYQFFVND